MSRDKAHQVKRSIIALSTAKRFFFWKRCQSVVATTRTFFRQGPTRAFDNLRSVCNWSWLWILEVHLVLLTPLRFTFSVAWVVIVTMCRPEVNVKVQDPAAKESGDEWLEDFDYEGFSKEVRTLGKKLESEQGPDDVKHLNKMLRWSNGFATVGLCTMGIAINPVSVVGLSLYTFSRWTMVAHHTCHGGYDKCHPNKRWNRFKFAVGSLWRRFNDWFDWMMPEAWNVEHNNRHHYNLNEITDPDLVEQNLSFLRSIRLPTIFKYGIVGFFMMTWKWFYYAPNTYKELKLAQMRRNGVEIPAHIKPEESITFKDCLFGQNYFYSFFELIGVVIAPYFAFHFFVAPLPWLWIGQYFGYGQSFYWNAVANLFLAELLTNVHGFLAVVTNHAGNDMYRFRYACRPFSGSFYLRQVLGSVDFHMGTDLIDFMHGFLNYQIEHHLWPSLTMRSYQKSAPLVRDICKRYGVPYVQENVFLRLKKTVDIMIGKSNMKWFPESYENKFLDIDAKAESAALDAQ